MSSSNQYNKNTVFSALCQMMNSGGSYTGYFFKVNSGSTNLPLIYDSSESDIDESDITDISISYYGNLLRTFDPIGGSITLNTITDTDLASINCYVGYTYQGTTPSDEPTADYKNINYNLNGFKGCCKVRYHNVGNTQTKCMYSWINDTIFKLYADVFGTVVILSGWATSSSATTPTVTESSPYPLTINDCYRDDASSEGPVIDLYPVVRTYSLNLYAATQTGAAEATHITLQNESGTVLATGSIPGDAQNNPILNSTGLPSGTYKLVVDNSDFNGIAIYGWRDGHYWDTTLSSVGESDLHHNASGEAYGTVYTFVLQEDKTTTIYIEKSYTVRIVSGFDSSNNTLDGVVPSDLTTAGYTQWVTSNSRTVDQTIYPRQYNTWKEPEYEAMQSITRTGYTFRGLRYYVSSTPNDYASGATIPFFPTVSNTTENRDYVMLWDAIKMNITSNLINYKKDKDGNLEKIEESIGKIVTTPASTVNYDGTVTMTTALSEGLTSVKYSDYYTLEGTYDSEGIDLGRSLTLLSKGDINLRDSGESITWSYYDVDGTYHKDNTAQAFVYDGTNIDLATTGKEIWRPYNHTKNYFNGWLVNGKEDADGILTQYTSVDSDENVILTVPASVLYNHFGGEIELTPTYVTYSGAIGKRAYTVGYASNTISLYDDGGIKVWGGNLSDVDSLTEGIHSTSRANWTIKYKSDDGNKLIESTGVYNDGNSGLKIDAEINEYVTPPDLQTTSGDWAGRFKFALNS